MPDSPKKYEQNEFMLRPQIIAEKKSPIKARRDRKISPIKSKSPEKNYYDPNLGVKSEKSLSIMSKSSPGRRASPSIRDLSP
jgi:hypothetical protein